MLTATLIFLFPALLYLVTLPLPSSKMMMLSRRKSGSLRVIYLKSFISKRIGLLNHLEPPEAYGLFFPNTKVIHTKGMQTSIAALFLDRHHKVLAKHPALLPELRIEGPQGTRHVVELSASSLARLNPELGEVMQLDVA